LSATLNYLASFLCRFVGSKQWYICECHRLQVLWSCTSHFSAGFKELT